MSGVSQAYSGIKISLEGLSMKNFKGIVVLLGAIGFSAHAMHNFYEEFQNNDLKIAVRNNDLAAVKALVESGSDVNILMTERGYLVTPLEIAAEMGNAEMVSYLLDAGAQLNKNIALAAKELPCVKLLVEAGADINYQNSRGDTALTCAVSSNYSDIVAYLLEKGADPLSDKHILNPLRCAADSGYKECAELIFNARINRLSKEEKQKLFCFGFCHKNAKGNGSILAWLPKDVAKLIAKILQCEFRNDNLKNVLAEVKSFQDSAVKKYLLETYSREEKKKE